MRFRLVAGDVPLDVDFVCRYRLVAAVCGVTPFGLPVDLALLVARYRAGVG